MPQSSIRTFRRSLGMTQKEFAAIINVSEASYCKREAGQLKFSLNDAYKFSNHFHKPIEEIFGNAEVSNCETG